SSGVIDKVFEVAEGALSSPGSRLLMAGNPTKTSGYFFDSHNKNRGSFTTLHFKTQDSPLAAPDYREKLVRKFGENSNVVRVRADGEFPKQEDDVLIALELVEPILFREPVQFVSGTKRRLGIDVARYGDDRTTFVLRAGPTIEHIHFHEKKDLMETVGRAAHLARAWHAHEICVDVNGMGGGVADRLRELGFTVIDVDVNVAAPGRPAGALFQADKMRDHLMLELLEWLEDPRASAYLAANESPEQKEMIEDMIGEIASVKYKLLSNGKLRIESKDEMKARGLRSPDFMEGLNMTLTPQRSGTGRISSAGKRVF
ncbi:MAG: hypothetical protein OEY63_09140, partial [Gemmatimonadota bacterium]|nr:hypothetical protein [Gemmatimonadota bacterium]